MSSIGEMSKVQPDTLQARKNTKQYTYCKAAERTATRELYKTKLKRARAAEAPAQRVPANVWLEPRVQAGPNGLARGCARYTDIYAFGHKHECWSATQLWYLQTGIDRARDRTRYTWQAGAQAGARSAKGEITFPPMLLPRPLRGI